MSDRPPRIPNFYLFVAGPWASTESFARALSARGLTGHHFDDGPAVKDGLRFEVVHEPNPQAGFRRGRRGMLPEADLAKVAQCSHGAVLEVGRRLHDNTEATANLGQALIDADGVAVRVESSGLAAPLVSWVEDVASGHPIRLQDASTFMVADGEGGLYTSGMHAFDLPDGHMKHENLDVAADWLINLCAFQIDQDPTMVSGHTFCPSPQEEPRIVERWPDARHAPDDGRYNPYGVWRLQPRSQARIQAQATVPVIMPPLASLLRAAEDTAGRQLTQYEVHNMTNSAPAIAMEPSDAMKLERGRGWADIEPALAFEQWQILNGRL